MGSFISYCFGKNKELRKCVLCNVLFENMHCYICRNCNSYTHVQCGNDFNKKNKYQYCSQCKSVSSMYIEPYIPG